MDLVTVSNESLLPADKEEAAELCKKAKQLIALAKSYVDRFNDAVRDNPEAFDGMAELQKAKKDRKIPDAQAAYKALTECALLNHDEAIGLCQMKVPAIEKACKPHLKEMGVPVKDQKKYIADLLGSALVVTERDKQEVKLVVKK